MTKIAVVLSDDGTLDKILVSDDIDMDILTRGKDDTKIDIAESELLEMQLN